MTSPLCARKNKVCMKSGSPLLKTSALLLPKLVDRNAPEQKIYKILKHVNNVGINNVTAHSD